MDLIDYQASSYHLQTYVNLHHRLLGLAIKSSDEVVAKQQLIIMKPKPMVLTWKLERNAASQVKDLPFSFVARLDFTDRVSFIAFALLFPAIQARTDCMSSIAYLKFLVFKQQCFLQLLPV